MRPVLNAKGVQEIGCTGRLKYKAVVKSLKTKDKDKAERELKKIIAEDAQADARRWGNTGLVDIPTILDMVDPYLDWYTENHPESLGWLKTLTGWGKKYIKAKKSPIRMLRLDEVTKSSIQTWYSWIRKHNAGRRGAVAVTNTTIKRISTLLSGIYNYAIDEEIIPPACKPVFPKIKAESREIRPFSTPEVVRLFMAADKINKKRHGLFVRLGVLAGLRLKEILSLRVQDVNFTNKTITIQRHDNGDGFTPKNYEANTVPVVDELLEVLSASVQDGEVYFFPSPKTGRFYQTEFGVQWELLMKKAGIPKDDQDCYPGTHSMRHTFATGLAKSGASTYEIQQLLRQKSQQMAERYISLIGGPQLKTALERLRVT